MVKHFLLLTLLAIAPVPFYAVPAFNKKQVIIVDGDSVIIYLRGDENCKFAVDDSGYTLLSVDDEWRYAEINQYGEIVPSPYKIVSECKKDVKTIEFLNSIKKGLTPKGRSAQRVQQTLSNAPAIGSRRVLVILMQFPDKIFTKSNTDFSRLFNEENYSEDGAVGSVYDYYKWASYGQLDLHSDIVGPYTSKNMMSYYGRNSGTGGNDQNPYELFEEAVNEACKTIQLSDYDANGDGYVDNIHIIYAGYGEEAGASSDAIWAHEMTFSPITVQGMLINKYSCAPELRGNRGTGISRIGPHCHEIGHALGAMDYYDTNYETGGNYPGTGKWDIMASGSWNDDGISPADFNPYVKIHDFGWTDPQTLILNEKNDIKTSSQEGNIYKVATPIQNDYFLLEYRDGKVFHAAEPGKGLLIFHIGPQLQSKSRTNTINTTYPQQCYVVCASSSYRKPSSSSNSYGNINSAGCPYPGTSHNTSFSDISTPASLTISGQSTGVSLTEIAMEDDHISIMYGDGNNDEPEPDPMNYSWSENFEEIYSIDQWRQDNSDGDYSVVMKISQEETPQCPVADNGFGYLQFEPSTQRFITTNRVKGKIETPTISLDASKQYDFSMKVRKYAKNHDVKDIISVFMLQDNSEIIPLINAYEVNNQEGWIEVSAVIPSHMGNYSLLLVCDVDYKSLMFVDNMSISERSIPSSIIDTNRNKDEIVVSSFYSLLGTQIKQGRKDLNIVRMSDGTIRKIMIK